jgi:hypothetical protein
VPGVYAYSINPKQFDGFRDRFTVTRAKDDSLEADLLTGSLRSNMRLFRNLSTVDPLIAEQREWSRIEETDAATAHISSGGCTAAAHHSPARRCEVD